MRLGRSVGSRTGTAIHHLPLPSLGGASSSPEGREMASELLIPKVKGVWSFPFRPAAATCLIFPTPTNRQNISLSHYFAFTSRFASFSARGTKMTKEFLGLEGEG